MIRNGEIGEPRREITITPEHEPVPERIVIPDTPEGIPLPEPQGVPA